MLCRDFLNLVSLYMSWQDFLAFVHVSQNCLNLVRLCKSRRTFLFTLSAGLFEHAVFVYFASGLLEPRALVHYATVMVMVMLMMVMVTTMMVMAMTVITMSYFLL